MKKDGSILDSEGSCNTAVSKNSNAATPTIWTNLVLFENINPNELNWNKTYLSKVSPYYNNYILKA